MAQVAYGEADRSVAPPKFRTGAGCEMLVIEPFPNWPRSFWPQQITFATVAAHT
jgi:hypothetical protein